LVRVFVEAYHPHDIFTVSQVNKLGLGDHHVIFALVDNGLFCISIIDFKDRLYVANNGGIARSTNKNIPPKNITFRIINITVPVNKSAPLLLEGKIPGKRENFLFTLLFIINSPLYPCIIYMVKATS